jgi:hypothetical protein
MQEALQIFSVREPYGEVYQIASVDVLDDQSGGTLLLPPDAPPVYFVETGRFRWGPVSNATGYRVEHLVNNRFQLLADVGDPAPVDDSTLGDALELINGGIVAPGYYRVRAYNAQGLGAPSNAMILEDQSS